MALYVGSNKQKINLDNIVYNINSYSAILIIEEMLLSSVDDYLFKDSNGLYIAIKEDK